MAPKGVIILALVAFLAQYAAGQMGMFGFPGQGFINPFQERPVVYYTCIGKNNLKDQLRITFREQEDAAPQQWWNRGRQNTGLQMDAYVSLGEGSPTQGTFQLLLTEYSHVEDGCIGSVVGQVVDERPLWFRQQGQETGVLGSSFTLNNYQRVVNTNVRLNQIRNFDMINGRGVVMCPLYGYNGGTCRGAIPLCCKGGRDSMNATSILQPMSVNQGMGGGMGTQMGGGMGGGMGGMGGQAGSLPGGLPGGTGNPPPSLPFKKK